MDRRKRRRLLSALQSGILEDIRSISNTAIASFTGDGRDLVRLVVGIEPVQAGSGDPSPDNVRPISGWAECKVTRTGKNLLDPSARTTSAQNIRYYQNDNLLLKAGTYTLSISSQVSGLYVNSGASTLFEKYNSTFLAFTLTEDTPVHFDFYKSGIDTSLLCQLEVGSTASSYEAYQGETYTIDLDGTRYGGTLDVTSGKLTIDRRYVLKPSCGNPLNQTNPAVILNLLVQAAAGVNGTANSKLISNCAKTVSANYQYANSVIAVALNSAEQIRLSVPGLTTQEQYQEWINDNNFEIVYPLATHIEVQLTPTQITTLSGTNNIWADTGDIILLEYMA